MLDDEKIICCDHGQPKRIKIKDKIRVCASRGDLTVDQDYRGKGVWSYSNEYATYTEKRENFDMVYYLTGNEKIIQRMKKIRPQFPQRLVNWVIIEDIEKHIEHMPVEQEWLIKLGVKILKALSRKTRIDKNPSLEIKEITYFGEEFQRFWNIVSKEYQFIVERDTNYLNWRYTDPRPGKHIIYAVYQSGTPLGYIVLRVNRYKEEYPVGYIVDLLTTLDDSEVARILIDTAKQYFKKQEINLVNCLMVKGSRYEKSLKENGFLDSRIKIHMFYQSNIEEDILSKVAPRELHFMWGDHDSLPLAVSRT